MLTEQKRLIMVKVKELLDEMDVLGMHSVLKLDLIAYIEFVLNDYT